MKHLLLLLIATIMCSYIGNHCYGQPAPFGRQELPAVLNEGTNFNLKNDKEETANKCYRKGKIAYKDKDYNKAIECFTNAIEKNYSPLKSVYNRRGRAKDDLGQYEAAIKDYDKAIQLDENYAAAYYNRGNTKDALREYEAAIKDYDKAIQLDNGFIDAINWRGVCKNSLGKYKAAINDYDKAIELDENYAYAYNNRGVAKKNLGEYEAAIKDYDIAIELDENYAAAYNNRGNAKKNSGQYEAAIKDFEKTIQLDDNHYKAYNSRGYCYLKIEEYGKAITDWEKMKKVAPSLYIPYYDYIAEAKLKLSEQPQQTLSKPIVSWEYPTTAYLKTNTSTHTLKACIESNSPITDVVLYIDQKPYSTRDFTIEEVNTTCDYEYKQKVEITSRNKPIYLTLEVKNSAGKVIAERVIEVEEKKIEEEKEQIEVKEEKRLALVVGNSKYKEGGNLKNPRNDAEDMTKTLEKLGFTVQRYYNLDEEKFKKAIGKFGRNLKNYDVGLFFYAGHGIQYKGKNYLVPTNAVLEYEANVEYECVDIGRVLSNMEGAKSDVNIVMLDACRNNPFERRWRRTSKGNGLAPTTAPQGTIIIYSADAGQVAADNPSDRNGLFTGELLKHITTKGLKIEDVLKRTGQSVFDKSGKQQMPASYSKFWGDFYFKR